MIAVAVGQQVDDISLFVPLAAMDQRVFAEDVLDRPPQRLDSVNAVANRRAGRRSVLVSSGGP
jgi:hypothetical protein